jgi:hypothetical protein
VFGHLAYSLAHIVQAPKLQRHVSFAEAAVAIDECLDPGECNLHGDVVDAVRWQAITSPVQIMAFRDAAVKEIEEMAAVFKYSGRLDEMLKDSDAGIRGISSAVNLPLLEWLLKKFQHPDGGVVKLFTEGAQLVGELHYSGVEGNEEVAVEAAEKLMRGRKSWNRSLRASLGTSEFGSARGSQADHALIELTKMDAALGRMTNPTIFGDDEEEHLHSKRFCLDQGLRSDGSKRLRPCDDETASWVNFYAQLMEKLKLDDRNSLHQLILSMHAEFSAGSNPVSLAVLKADVDSAFRRVPIKPEHRKLAAVLFGVGDCQYSSTHLALPFGFTGSVVAWARVGAARPTSLRRALRMGVSRYVDVIFTFEQEAVAAHALECMTRVVRAILGQDSLSEDKLAVSRKEVVLGVEAELTDDEVTYRIPTVKRTKWGADIAEALRCKKLRPDRAGVLGGRLGFACQSIFSKLGRAMVRPVYDRQHLKDKRASEIGNGSALQVALSWWKTLLDEDIVQSWPLSGTPRDSVTILCDAASTPPTIAAVVASKGQWYFHYVRIVSGGAGQVRYAQR